MTGATYYQQRLSWGIGYARAKWAQDFRDDLAKCARYSQIGGRERITGSDLSRGHVVTRLTLTRAAVTLHARMGREEHIEFQGRVIEVLPAGNFKIELENGHQVLAHLGGKLRKHRIRVVLGDKVTVALTPYDPTRGIVVYRG